MRKKRHAPLGWRKPDPRRYRFALPNSVWEHHLTPEEFVVLAYLVSRFSHGRDEKSVRPEAIADTVHLTASTAKKCLAALAEHRLIFSADNPAPTIHVDSGTGKFFSLPNEIFLLGLSSPAFAVYAFLLTREDRRTHVCYPSFGKISKATGLRSVNTVRKYVAELEERQLITTERTLVVCRRGRPQNGCLRYKILPICVAVERFHQRQMAALEREAERRRILERQEEYDRRHPTATLRATVTGQGGT